MEYERYRKMSDKRQIAIDNARKLKSLEVIHEDSQIMRDLYEKIEDVSSPFREFSSKKTNNLAKKIMILSKKTQKDLAKLSKEVENLAKVIK